MSIYENIYNYGRYILYLLYGLTIIGIWNSAPQYLKSVEYFYQIFIGLVLVYINNPFTNHKYRPIDKKIAFSAGFFLLTSTTLSAFLNRLQHPLEKYDDNE